MKKIYTIILSLLLLGCKYVFIAEKRNVISDHKGFIMFYKNDIYFFRSKQISDSTFLLSKTEEGIYFHYEDYPYFALLQNLAKRYEIKNNYAAGNSINSEIDSVAVIRVLMKSYPAKKHSNGERRKIIFELAGKDKVVSYFSRSNKIIISIFPTDLQIASEFYRKK